MQNMMDSLRGGVNIPTLFPEKVGTCVLYTQSNPKLAGFNFPFLATSPTWIFSFRGKSTLSSLTSCFLVTEPLILLLSYCMGYLSVPFYIMSHSVPPFVSTYSPLNLYFRVFFNGFYFFLKKNSYLKNTY